MNLRNMEWTDAEFMLSLKNDPQTREYAIISKDEIKLENHLKFLEKNIRFFKVMVDDNGTRIGALRVQDDEISIWISKEYRGQQLAKFFIKKVRYPGMMAKIVNGNIPSFRAFISAGFKPVGYRDNFYILKF